MPSVNVVNVRGHVVSIDSLPALNHYLRLGYTPQSGTLAAARALFTDVPAEPGSLSSFGPVDSPTPEAFNLPLTTNGATVNPTLVMGVDPITGILYGIDRPTDDLSMSANGSTWTHDRGMPANVNHVQLHKVVRFGDHIYLFAISGADQRAGIYRATAPTAPTQTITWGTRLAAMAVSTSRGGANYESLNGKSTCFNAGTSALMLGDYGDFAGGPSIQRSLDGTTWTTVWQSATSRHVHAVAEDPYNPGHWYATVGDGATNTNGVIRSTDNGTTWQAIVTGTNGNLFQAVQVSFSKKFVYLAADHYGASAYYFERGDSPTVRNLTFGSHWNMPVPGGVGGRIITDLATTAGSAAVTSASFTAQDRGRVIQTDNVPLFAAVSNAAEPNWLTGAGAGTATLRRAATATGTGQTAFVGGDRFYVGSYLGVVDPATDIFYFAAMDTSSAGNVTGIFAVPRPGSQPVLLSAVTSPPTHWNYTWEAFIHNGWVYFGPRRFPAIAD